MAMVRSYIPFPSLHACMYACVHASSPTHVHARSLELLAEVQRLVQVVAAAHGLPHHHHVAHVRHAPLQQVRRQGQDELGGRVCGCTCASAPRILHSGRGTARRVGHTCTRQAHQGQDRQQQVSLQVRQDDALLPRPPESGRAPRPLKMQQVVRLMNDRGMPARSSHASVVQRRQQHLHPGSLVSWSPLLPSGRPAHSFRNMKTEIWLLRRGLGFACYEVHFIVRI